MPRKTLTASYVDKIRPPIKGQVEHFDLGFPGLALRVSYAGAKSWRFSYRLGGLPRRLCLGTYPAISLIEARDAWRAARIAVLKGVDPAAREDVSRRDTFSVAVGEWIKRDKADCKASTVGALERIVAFDLLPAWGNRRVDQITKRDVIELLDKIGDRAPTQARAVQKHLNSFFAWAHGREVVIANPMTGLKLVGPESERDRVLTDGEAVKIWNASSEHGPSGAALRLLLLTGARREEICQLRWSEIDGDTIRLEGARTKSGKPHTIALSAPARALLEQMPRVGEFVFSFDGGKKPVNNWTKVKTRVDAAAGVKDWKIHDFRRTVATGLQKLGVNLQTIEAVLGHTSGSRAGIVGVYQRHAFLDEARAALEAWGAYVTGLIEGREAGKVLPMRRA